MIEIAGRIFNPDAFDSIIPGTRPGTTYVTLRGGSSTTLDMEYEMVRVRLARFGLLTSLPVRDNMSGPL